MFNFHNKTFRSISNSSNGEVGSETFFYYQQFGNIITATYNGGTIKRGHLIAIIDDNGQLNMRYHHINQNNELMTGTCFSKPELLENGKLRLHEVWQWTSGDNSAGSSIIEEI